MALRKASDLAQLAQCLMGRFALELWNIVMKDDRIDVVGVNRFSLSILQRRLKTPAAHRPDDVREERSGAKFWHLGHNAKNSMS